MHNFVQVFCRMKVDSFVAVSACIGAVMDIKVPRLRSGRQELDLFNRAVFFASLFVGNYGRGKSEQGQFGTR